MTDGPHRSLQLKRPWKNTAQRMASESFSIQAACEALDTAVRAELASIPFEAINRIMRGGDIPSLFDGDVAFKITQLESARELCRGSSVGTSYIDSLVIGAIDAVPVENAIRGAVLDCIKSVVQCSKLSAIEHYKRKGASAQAVTLSRRWDEASNKCDFNVHIGEVMSAAGLTSRRSSVSRQEGLDDGPER